MWCVLYLLLAEVEYFPFLFSIFLTSLHVRTHIVSMWYVLTPKNNVLFYSVCLFSLRLSSFSLSHFLSVSPFRCVSLYWCLVVRPYLCVHMCALCALMRACLCECVSWYTMVFFDVCWYHWTAGRQEKTAIIQNSSNYICDRHWHLRRKCVCLCGCSMCARVCWWLMLLFLYINNINSLDLKKKQQRKYAKNYKRIMYITIHLRW